ncbi:MAG: hypothetical protein HYV77_03415, partial [Candidatus Wildermuthbacteria bacterium]|nr:hypothetical protein [Candidatus Wildermuthbacteria bacterium]
MHIAFHKRIAGFGRKKLWLVQFSVAFIVAIAALAAVAYPLLPLAAYYLFPFQEDDFITEASNGLATHEEQKQNPVYFARNTLVIPKIGVEIPIIEGADEKALWKGAWRLPETSSPDKGSNTVI